MTKLLLAAILGLLSSSARALGPVTIETQWNEKTASISTSGVTSFTFDVGGFGGYGYAIVNATYTQNGVDGTTWGSTATVSTTTANVLLSSYSLYPIGGGGTYTISQTLKTPPKSPVLYANISGVNGVNNTNTFLATSNFPSAVFFVSPQISTSSTINIISGTPYSHDARGKITNPVFTFSGLTAAATYYLSVDFLLPAIQ